MKLPAKAKMVFAQAFYFFALPSIALAAGITEKYDQLYNPLPSNEIIACPTVACDLTQMVLLITRNILQLIPIASVLFIIIGGFKMMASQGNEEKLKDAKRTIYWAIVGLIIAFLSFSIIAIARNLLGVTTNG